MLARISILTFIILIVSFWFYDEYKADLSMYKQTMTHTETVKQEKPKTITKQETKTNTYKKVNKDPLSLSRKTPFYYGDEELRKILSNSKLEYPSKAEYIGNSHYKYSWILKSNNKEVYECDYSYSRIRNADEKSIVACEFKEAYEDFENGDSLLYRDYYMPTLNEEIMISNKDTYYKSHYALGKYSDMNCYVKGNNLYCTFNWYQKTDKGPMLVYTVNTTNKIVTASYRYNSWLWDSFDESMNNIDNIPYEQYPRAYDYYEVYKKWESDSRIRRIEEELKEEIELYCVFDDPEDLFYEYPDEFEYYEDAEDFYDDYCN